MIDTMALAQSGVLTLVGMAVIFLFMGLLIVIMHFFVAIASRFLPDREDDGESPASGAPRSADEETAAAIATALFRKGGK